MMCKLDHIHVTNHNIWISIMQLTLNVKNLAAWKLENFYFIVSPLELFFNFNIIAKDLHQQNMNNTYVI